MVTRAEHGTAGECARRLLDALDSGSDERIYGALDRIANLTSVWSSDSQESEFRDLLAGIVQPISGAVPEFRSFRNSSSKHVVVQMLAHVASSAA
jgi:hypothetical protein